MAEAFQRLVVLALDLKQIAEPAVCLPQRRRQCDRPAQRADGLVRTSLPFQCRAAIVMRYGEIRAKANRPLQAIECEFHLIGLQAHYAGFAVEGRVVQAISAAPPSTRTAPRRAGRDSRSRLPAAICALSEIGCLPASASSSFSSSRSSPSQGS